MTIVKRARLPFTLEDIETIHVSGVDAAPILEAAIRARTRHLPDNPKGLIEAAVEGLNLVRFVDSGYLDPEFKTLSGMRAAAPSNPIAALALANRLLNGMRELSHPPAFAGVSGWAARRANVGDAFAAERARLRSELVALLPSLGEAERERIQRALPEAD